MKKDDMIKSLKQARKLAREQEIALYGKPICHSMVEKNKKKYSRKRKHLDDFFQYVKKCSIFAVDLKNKQV